MCLGYLGIGSSTLRDLEQDLRERSGTIIKTIGDAVMAGFERPQDAVRASIEMIEGLSRFKRAASRPLGLKVGVHKGRAIAVTLNDRIDYFGEDVNIAARVQGLADVNEVCIQCNGDGGPKSCEACIAFGRFEEMSAPGHSSTDDGPANCRTLHIFSLCAKAKFASLIGRGGLAASDWRDTCCNSAETSVSVAFGDD